MKHKKINSLTIERLKRGWSLTQAAKEVGISRQWYYFIELGKIKPSLEIAGKIEKTFKKPIDQLLREVK